jgi:hypothetical protein
MPVAAAAITAAPPAGVQAANRAAAAMTVDDLLVARAAPGPVDHDETIDPPRRLPPYCRT